MQCTGIALSKGYIMTVPENRQKRTECHFQKKTCAERKNKEPAAASEFPLMNHKETKNGKFRPMNKMHEPFSGLTEKDSVSSITEF